MNCLKARRLIDAYVDGEIDIATAVDVDEHLEACPECAWLHESRIALRSSVRKDTGFRAPEGLEARVRTAVRRAASGEPAEPAPAPRDRASDASPPRSRAWLAVAASILCVAVASAVVWRAVTPERPDDGARDAVASHVRSLMADHLTDVPSSDRHTVRPWFDGKIDFAPYVVDLADRDFTLIGGRLDYIDDAPVAALVYQRRLHVINVFVRPDQGGRTTPDRIETYKGYSVVSWVSGGMAYRAVSDLNAGELQELSEAIRSRTGASTAP